VVKPLVFTFSIQLMLTKW